MTVEDEIRGQIKAEIGDVELPENEKYMLLQKYGIAMPVYDRRIDNPGWVPETNDGGKDTWKARRQFWNTIINQAKKSKR